MKRLFLILFLCFLPLTLFANGVEVEINSECVYLDDLLGAQYPHSKIQCGFLPGDRKLIPMMVISAAAKRAGVNVKVTSDYSVIRTGLIVEDSFIISEITRAYENAYPEYEITVDAVKTNRTFYISPEFIPEVTVKTDKFGTNYAAVTLGTQKSSFPFTVKAVAEGYVTTERVAAGESFSNKVEKQLVDVTNIRNTLAKNPEGMMAARALPKGRVVTADLVKDMPELVKGDRVRLVYKSGTINIEIEGIAEGNAYRGKPLLVKNSVTGKVVNTIYQGDGKALMN